MCSTKVRSFWSTSGTCRVTLATNAMIGHAWGKDRPVLVTSETSVVNEGYSKNSQLGLAWELSTIGAHNTRQCLLRTVPPHLLRLALPKGQIRLISTDDAKWSFATPIVAQQAYTHSRCFFQIFRFIIIQHSTFNNKFNNKQHNFIIYQ
jgi:hypothetical protein